MLRGDRDVRVSECARCGVNPVGIGERGNKLISEFMKGLLRFSLSTTMVSKSDAKVMPYDILETHKPRLVCVVSPSC